MPEIMVVEGNNVTLNCSAEEGEIQWYKDGELLMNNSQTAIYTDILENSSSSTSFLELNSVEGRNTGSYSCQIVNEAGNFSVAEFGIQVDLGKLQLMNTHNIGANRYSCYLILVASSPGQFLAFQCATLKAMARPSAWG